MGFLKHRSGDTLSNNAPTLRLLDSGEATTEVTLCLSEKHHGEGDIMGDVSHQCRGEYILPNNVDVLKHPSSHTRSTKASNTRSIVRMAPRVSLVVTQPLTFPHRNVIEQRPKLQGYVCRDWRREMRLPNAIEVPQAS